MAEKHLSRRRPTQYDVARLAGVSQVAVSKVLNNSPSIYLPEETRRRILRAMDTVGYKPNVLARSLRMGKTHTLGLILPDSSNPFFAEIGKHIEARAFSLGYSLIICNTEGDPAREQFYSEVLYCKQVDGIIFVSSGNQPDCLRSLLDYGLPLVVVDRELPGCVVDVVMLDNFQGGYLAAQHLISLGHRKIACITGPSNVNPSSERVSGFKTALEENGIGFNHGRLRQADLRMESGWRLAYDLFNQPDPPTAIFACNDLMALGVLRAAAESGLRVPHDLSVVGFDNIALSSYTTPPLTTIAQPTDQISMRTIDLLMERIKSKEKDPARELLPAALIVRASSAAVS